MAGLQGPLRENSGCKVGNSRPKVYRLKARVVSPRELSKMENKKGPNSGLKEYYALILVMASFLILIAEVFLRYVIGSSMEWTDEISRLLLVWMTFTGIGLVILERKEIFAQVFTQKLSPQAKKNLVPASIDLLVLGLQHFPDHFRIADDPFLLGHQRPRAWNFPSVISMSPFPSGRSWPFIT